MSVKVPFPGVTCGIPSVFAAAFVGDRETWDVVEQAGWLTTVVVAVDASDRVLTESIRPWRRLLNFRSV